MNTEIDWGYNCLTQGVHHGRPEAVWNLPLMFAVKIYSATNLSDLVIARIYNDALQYVENPIGITGNEVRWTHEWADRVKRIAGQRYPHVLQSKVGELRKYYDSAAWELDTQELIRWVQKNKLNPGYQPLHPHDSINLLCRILGTSSSIEASKEGGS